MGGIPIPFLNPNQQRQSTEGLIASGATANPLKAKFFYENTIIIIVYLPKAYTKSNTAKSAIRQNFEVSTYYVRASVQAANKNHLQRGVEDITWTLISHKD